MRSQFPRPGVDPRSESLDSSCSRWAEDTFADRQGQADAYHLLHQKRLTNNKCDGSNDLKNACSDT